MPFPEGTAGFHATSCGLERPLRSSRDRKYKAYQQKTNLSNPGPEGCVSKS